MLAEVPLSHPAVDSVELDGELVLFDERNHRVHQLDRVGAVIWPLLDGTATVAELVTDLADGFAVPRETVEPELVRLLKVLTDLDLLAGSVGHGAETKASPEVSPQPQPSVENLGDPPAP